MIELNLTGDEALRILKFADRHKLTVSAAMEAIELARDVFDGRRPQDATETTRDDHIARWADATLTRCKGARITSKDLRASYKSWCYRQGLPAVNPTVLGRAMTRLGYRRRKTGGTMEYEGVAVRALL